MSFFRNIIDLIRKRNYRYGAITNEVLPLFHDRFMCTNKEFTELTLDDKRLEKVQIETQNGEPVFFHKGFNESFEKGHGKHYGDFTFSKSGLSHGDVVKIKNEGYLENRDNIYEVILITDRFVYLKNLTGGCISKRSHEEIERMRSMGGLE